MTMTSTPSYFKRLGLHGSRLLWRVLMVLVTVIGAAVWGMVKHFLGSHEASSSFDNGDSNSPVIGSRSEAWDAFDNGQIGAAEMAYYEDVYAD